MRLLHCTDVLPKPAYSCDPWYLERGKAVHLACHYADTVGLDRSTLDPRIVGYVDAWERCKRETGLVVDRSEVAVGGPLFGYIGMLDKIMAGKSWEMWDIKCGQPEPWHGLQLAAYCHAYGGRIKFVRRTCHLMKDGTYRLVEHTGKDDLKTFMGYLTVAYWEINNGLREWPALREGEAA